MMSWWKKLIGRVEPAQEEEKAKINPPIDRDEIIAEDPILEEQQEEMRQHGADDKIFDWQNQRNVKGNELERAGRVDEAIKQYEMNVADGFVGPHPYNRLAVIYRRRKRVDQEIRVLERAIDVFVNKVHPGRADRLPKLERFKERLEKAKKLTDK